MMDSSITLKPLTASGEAWVKKYTHPPSRISGVEGIPDFSTMSSTVVDFVNEFTLGSPTGTGTGTWSVLIISLPHPRYPLLALRWLGTVAPNPIASADVIWLENTSFRFGNSAVNWEAAVSRYRPTASSSTIYFDASDLYNQGKVFSNQLGMADSLFTNSGSPVKPTDAIQVNYNLGQLPVTGGQILQSSSKARSALAKTGAFQVMRFIDPAAQYMTGGTQEITLGWATDFGTQTISMPGGGLNPPFYVGMSVGYTLFQGLLDQATLSVKRVHCYEVVPDIGSPWAPFAQPGPCPDEPAMNLAATEMFKLPDALDSDSNDLGSFFNAAKSLGPVLKGVWGVAKPALKAGLGTLPAGGLLNQVLDAVEGLAMEDSGKSKKVGGKKLKQASKPVQKATPIVKMGMAGSRPLGQPLSKTQKKRLRQLQQLNP